MAKNTALYERKSECCGCSACYSVCPTNAIEMLVDEEGFLYPRVSDNNCRHCGKCNEVCAFKSDLDTEFYSKQSIKVKSYAVKHTDDYIRRLSRSGGVFTAISDYVLSNSGVVYGSVLNDRFLAEHIGTTDPLERDKMRGSKYIQSSLNNVFKDIQEDLKKDKLVLFTGTSCQTAGLKSFLDKDYDNLLTVDIVCHGVPSPKVWSDYISWNESAAKSSCVKVDFRNKTEFGWRAHKETLWFENGKQISSDVFKTMFYKHEILRPSCFKCPYKSIYHPGDMTIADFWGIENVVPEYDDNKGVSLVILNNKKGEQFFGKIEKTVDYVETNINDSLQEPLKRPFPEPEDRIEFWKDYSTKDFGYIAKKYGGYGLSNKLKRKTRKYIKNLLGR